MSWRCGDPASSLKMSNPWSLWTKRAAIFTLTSSISRGTLSRWFPKSSAVCSNSLMKVSTSCCSCSISRYPYAHGGSSQHVYPEGDPQCRTSGIIFWSWVISCHWSDQSSKWRTRHELIVRNFRPWEWYLVAQVWCHNVMGGREPETHTSLPRRELSSSSWFSLDFC